MTQSTIFLSTPSARRATGRSCVGLGSPCNFYPRPPRGGRHVEPGGSTAKDRISIHALREEGDERLTANLKSDYLFLSTPSARRATGAVTSAYPLVSHISIHALREEGDGFGTILRRGMVAFLSTPSARRATMILIWYMNADEDFYPRPPRGGRPGQQTANDTPIGISIHALREEGDVRLLYQRQPPCGFLSTPSARRATMGHG